MSLQTRIVLRLQQSIWACFLRRQRDQVAPAAAVAFMLSYANVFLENQRISSPQLEESNNLHREAEAFPATRLPHCSVDPGFRSNDTSGKKFSLEVGSMAESTTNTEIFQMFGAPVIKRESMEVIGLETDQLITSPSRTRRTPRSEVSPTSYTADSMTN